jgi:hypothetical protein
MTQIRTTVPRWTVLTPLLLASMLGPMAGATIMPVLEVICGDLGVSGTAAGLIMASTSIVSGYLALAGLAAVNLVALVAIRPSNRESLALAP